jgi:predicted ABC-type ATPase
MTAEPVASPGQSDDAIALAAAKAADARVLSGIEAGMSVIRETVLSTDRFKPIVDMAIGRGFKFGLNFVMLASAEACVERVRLRIALGGHSVPPDRTRACWSRSIAKLTWFAERADIVLVYDNSALGAPVLLYEKQGGVWLAHRTGRIPEIDATVAPLLGVGRLAR